MVYDFGGGKFEVSVVTITNKGFEVRDTAGIVHYGGEDLTSKIVEHCCSEFQRKTKYNIRTNPRSMRRLRTQCERIKKVLSTEISSSIEIDSLGDGKDYYSTLTRVRFEEICQESFISTITFVEKVLKNSKLSPSQID